MKISIHVDTKLTDAEISISCNRLTPEIEKVLATLRILDRQVTAIKGEETYLLDVSKIVYMEAVDRKTFVYTEEDFYESRLKLYELEQVIKLSNVGHQYGEKNMLKDINLDIDSGKIFGLLGPSGAGKTILINILTGQLRQTLGTAELFGKDTRKLKNADYKKIGIMMDHFGLYDRFSCYDNLKLFARIYGIPNKDIEEALGKVGLLEAKKKKASNLSKGMRSRLLLARVLMVKPSILFLDENWCMVFHCVYS